MVEAVNSTSVHFVGALHEPLNRQFFDRTSANLAPLMKEGIRVIFFLEALCQSKQQSREWESVISGSNYKNRIISNLKPLVEQKLHRRLIPGQLGDFLDTASAHDFLRIGFGAGDYFFMYHRASMIQRLRTPETLILFEASSDSALARIRKLTSNPQALGSLDENLNEKKFRLAIKANKSRLTSLYEADQIRDRESARYLEEVLRQTGESPVLLVPIFGASHHYLADRLAKALAGAKITKDLGPYPNMVVSQIDTCLRQRKELPDLLSAREIFASRAQSAYINNLIEMGHGEVVINRYEDIVSFVNKKAQELSVRDIEKILLNRDSRRAILSYLTPLKLSS